MKAVVWLLGCVCFVTLVWLSPAGATTVVFADFSDTMGLVLNGSTVGNLNNGIDLNPVLRLVPAAPGQSGSAFSQTTLEASKFSTFFQFRLTSPGGIHDGYETGADGLVFVVQPVSSSIGGSGGGLGYQGISPSVGVEFDTWYNGWDGNTNHVGIDTNGSMSSLTSLFLAPRFDNGSLWSAWVDYDGTVLEVRANQTGIRPEFPTLSLSINVPGVIGTNTAYVGFTAGTGSAWENHDIVTWEYRDEFSPIGKDDPVMPEPLTMLTLGLSSVALVRYAKRRK